MELLSLGRGFLVPYRRAGRLEILFAPAGLACPKLGPQGDRPPSRPIPLVHYLHPPCAEDILAAALYMSLRSYVCPRSDLAEGNLLAMVTCNGPGASAEAALSYRSFGRRSRPGPG